MNKIDRILNRFRESFSNSFVMLVNGEREREKKCNFFIRKKRNPLYRNEKLWKRKNKRILLVINIMCTYVLDFRIFCCISTLISSHKIVWFLLCAEFNFMRQRINAIVCGNFRKNLWEGEGKEIDVVFHWKKEVIFNNKTFDFFFHWGRKNSTSSRIKILIEINYFTIIISYPHTH